MLALHDLGIKGLFRAILLRRGDGRRCLALITVFALLALSGCAKKPLLAPEIGPSADFIGEPRAGPSPLAVDFTDKSTTGSSSITSWLWMFGDGATSTDPNPSHSYADSGTYTVSLRVATSVGIDTLTKFAYIVVSPTALLGPRADFIGTPRSGSKPLTVQFTDQSTNGSEPITSWSWTFGDGATSTARNPSHTYNSGGTYTVSLTVQTSVGSDTETMLDFIDVRVGPTAEFVGSPRNGIQPLAVQFTDQSIPGTSSITSWSWAFGDGGTSTAQSPSHTYTAAGTYTVSLTVTTAEGSATQTKSDYIVIGNTVPPTAAFSGAPTSGTTPLAVQFTDESTAGTSPITSWAWTFGDGGTSAAQSPSHTYTSPGTYSISLTVTSSVGSDAVTKANYITAAAPKVPPTADFSGSPTSGLAPLAVQFTDQSTAGSAAITSWAWTFGDGGTSTAQSPSHAYPSAGTYTVSLRVTTADGSDGETKTGYITVNPRAGPTAAFSGSPTSGLSPLAVQFTDQSTTGTSQITSWAWTFGDGETSTSQNPSHTYTAAGTYTVSLTVTTADGSDGETKTGYITVNPRVGPTAAFSGSPTSGAPPLVVQFTDESTAGTSPITSWAWTFGDGGTSTAQSPSHTYLLPGDYTVSLTVTTADGSDGETKTGYIDVRIGPTAAFSGSPTSGLVPLQVQFTDESGAGSSPITSRAWTFGDGGTSTAQNPSHTYTAAGTYTVSLTVTTADGSDGETKTGYIDVRIGPTAAFSGSPTSGLVPLQVQFTDESGAGSSPITSRAWTFGDGGTSTAQSPSHTYLLPGAYTVSLTVTTSDGTDAVTKVDYITATLLAPEP